MVVYTIRDTTRELLPSSRRRRRWQTDRLSMFVAGEDVSCVYCCSCCLCPIQFRFLLLMGLRHPVVGIQWGRKGSGERKLCECVYQEIKVFVKYFVFT